jgi:hypothetical protein
LTIAGVGSENIPESLETHMSVGVVSKIFNVKGTSMSSVKRNSLVVKEASSVEAWDERKVVGRDSIVLEDNVRFVVTN